MSQVSTSLLTYSFADFLSAHSQHLPLDRAMIWMSFEEFPDAVDPAEMLVWLDELAAGVCMPPSCERFEALARINYHLFHELGFTGDSENYDDPENSCLGTVLSRRKGLPIVLSAIYMEVARRCGIDVHGIGFPGHFFVSPVFEGQPFFLDAFNHGRVSSQEELLSRLDRLATRALPFEEAQKFLQPVSHQSMLIRMNVNLKYSYWKRQNWEGGLRAVERILSISPTRTDDIRDRGLLLSKLSRFEESIEALEYYLVACPAAGDVVMVREHLVAVRSLV